MLAVQLKLCKYCNKLAVPKVLVNPMEAKAVDIKVKFVIKKSISWFYFEDLENKICLISKKHIDYDFCQTNEKQHNMIFWSKT